MSRIAPERPRNRRGDVSGEAWSPFSCARARNTATLSSTTNDSGTNSPIQRGTTGIEFRKVENVVHDIQQGLGGRS